MTHEGRLIAGTGVWTGGAFEANRPELLRRLQANTVSHRVVNLMEALRRSVAEDTKAA